VNLAPPGNFKVKLVSRNDVFVLINWTQPERVVLYPSDTDVLYYQVEVLNLGLERKENISVAGNVTTFLYQPTSHDHCSVLQFCVHPIRSAGLANVEECVRTSLKKGDNQKKKKK